MPCACHISARSGVSFDACLERVERLLVPLEVQEVDALAPPRDRVVGSEPDRLRVDPSARREARAAFVVAPSFVET